MGEIAWHMGSAASATCRKCSEHQISGGKLWLWASDRAQSDLFKWISPDSVTKTMRLGSHSADDAEFRVASDAVQVSVDGLERPARVLSINDRDGRSGQVVAFALARACLSLSGILYEKDGAPTSIDRFDAFASAIAMEYYKPDGRNFIRPPGPAGELHIGDLKRPLLGEQP